MKRIFTLTLNLILFVGVLSAQEYGQASFGPNYSEQAYFRFSDLSAENIANESWDLAFSVEGAFSVGVHYNEAVPASFTGEAPKLELYLAPVDSWDAPIDLESITDTLYNPETSWDEGALNIVKDPENQLDFGWGVYNPVDHSVNGDKVFVIKLRDNSYRKFEVTSLISGVYTFTYAELDGSNEAVVTIDGAQFDSPLAYFSFETGEAFASPASWDLLFSRYVTPLDAGGGQIINYTVAGVLTGPGTQVAVAAGVPQYEANQEDYVDAYDSKLDLIGHTWKDFDLGAFSWVIQDSLSYFVKTADEHLWKLIFIDFEGSSTGTATFEVEDLGTVDVQDPTSNVATFGVFPNPVDDHFALSLELREQPSPFNIYIMDVTGKVVWQSRKEGVAGLNVYEFNGLDFPAGVYSLTVDMGGRLISSKLIKQ
ncbi:MAG: T9SS C-terminal target domain-containing protein [Bacteroidetes bacterium]|nr:MAG: T9SS C-terminal target domain-containing protein [Bacteroidota bacterium]